jgi:SanA protein
MARSDIRPAFAPQAPLGGIEVAYVEPQRPSMWRAFFRRLLGLFLVLLLLGVVLVAGADVFVRFMARGAVHADSSAIEPGRPALVFGTSARLADGRENRYFTARMEAAAKLFHEGRVTFLILSGDNRSVKYNEPVAMRKALVALGVPKDKIVLDFAGFRTLDSVVRAKEIFGQTRVVFVSQGFHNERAIFLARHSGIEAEALDAGGEPGGFAYWRNWLRERMARILMLLDLYVLDTSPHHLGPREAVPGEGAGETGAPAKPPAPANPPAPAAPAIPAP